MSSSWWFLYQQKGGEEAWQLTSADRREEVQRSLKPAFVTVLDLSLIPDDNDWSKTKYRGPLYFDFDADGDLELACNQFKVFLAKLSEDYDVDLAQVKLYASGGKGFHVEIPQECFMTKVTPTGVAWLPYIYKTMADSVVVDTMDMRVYTGKRGRMWRTPNVQRESGRFKVQMQWTDAMEVTPESYVELTSSPSPGYVPAPPTVNAKLAMLYERSREKVVAHMRGRKKRVEKANAFLDPWKKSQRTPPTIEALMRGENVKPNAGWNQIAMQLAIYATSVAMPLNLFLDNCRGLCDNYEGDSGRYGTSAKRREQLADQYRYMDESDIYEFDVAPIAKLLAPGTDTSDLGVEPPPAPKVREGGVIDHVADAADLKLQNIRRGFKMDNGKMYRTVGDDTDTVCRGHLSNIEAFRNVETRDFKGYEFDLHHDGRFIRRTQLPADAFLSCLALKRFFSANEMSFQGTDADAMALLDVLQEMTMKKTTFTYPREGLFVLDNPLSDDQDPVLCYLTQHEFLSSIDPEDEKYFKLKYRPEQALSAYNIDIHRAPNLKPEDARAIRDLFSFSKEDVVADLVGWFIACHYRSIYLRLFKQFPLLQVHGQAGSGKSQTVMALSRLHWYLTPSSLKSAAGLTPFVMDMHASTSTSAPFIIDEYKPRELKNVRGRYEKFKDTIKANYIGAEVGERGTINRGAESNLAVIKSTATAPICFMGEAVENETAVMERSVAVALSKSLHNAHRTAAFKRLQESSEAISAFGRAFVDYGFQIDLDEFRRDFRQIEERVVSALVDPTDKHNNPLSPRELHNAAVIAHAWTIAGRVLQNVFGSEFDDVVSYMITVKMTRRAAQESSLLQHHTMSELSKVLNRMSMLSRDQGAPWEIVFGQDYLIGDGWMELKVDRAFDKYRRWAISIGETALFDNMDAWLYSINSFGAAIDKACASSELRGEDGGSDKIVRFDLSTLRREGVSTFRSQ